MRVWRPCLARGSLARVCARLARIGCLSCGCLSEVTLGDVEKARKKTYSYQAQGNREWMRGYLAANVNEGARIGYNLRTPDSKVTLCPHGFDMYHGFGIGWTYTICRKQRDGVVADDPNLGGKRLQSRGDAFVDDSEQKMAIIGWFQELRDDTELMPNVNNKKERHLDFIEVGALYQECKLDLIDSGTPADAVGSQVRACDDTPLLLPPRFPRARGLG